MPLALPELQAAFAAHVAGVDRVDLLRLVAGDSISAEARLRVYRHHVSHSLCAALAATFPTVQTLVGEAFFQGLAASFVARSLPDRPVLSEYGAGFADFIADYPPAAGLPYLADVARLDWALNAAFHSPAGARLAASDLAALPPERLLELSIALPEGASIVSSPFPIDRIWEASQPDAPGETVDLASGGSALLVLRRADDAVFIVLAPGEAAFVGALDAGVSLERAAEQAVAADAAFDLSTGFARLLALEAFAALR